MELIFNEQTNQYEYHGDLPEDTNTYYAEVFIKYFNILFQLYSEAFEVSEYSALMTLLAVRGIEDPGWDPYESTLNIVDSVRDIHGKVEDYVAQKNLQLWSYCHILEASEPYEKIMNLLSIINGKEYTTECFPANKRGNPQTPGQKIAKIKELSRKLAICPLEDIFDDLWDKQLRNSIFHSDYSFYGEYTRTRNPFREFTGKEINEKINKTLAYLDSMRAIHKNFISSYEEPCLVDLPKTFSGRQSEKARVIVRKKHGAVGIKDNYSIEELRKGFIPFRLGRFYDYEIELLNKDSELALLPAYDKSNHG